MSKKRFNYIFSGDVQAVGFRYTASRLANQLCITGWVRNLYDGTVEMEAQGFSSDLAMLLRELQEDLYIRIDYIESNEIPLIDEKSFQIK